MRHFHAQREASEAYIKSQAHEGWACLTESYDDGGYSGGSMERPALQKLLDDVREEKLDVIVVYKVDRLTRSLADFAKLVELFDANNVSFVSVTQSFNTTSSMGRLTLNVLLSFAQFEREVTGERIRDKVQASRKKGMWMGGPAPLGYRAANKKLIVDEQKAEIVRQIFASYLELGSLPKLARKLADLGIKSRRRHYSDGRLIGGQNFRTGALCQVLSNRIYFGEVRYHDKHFKGEHNQIIASDVFNAVQSALAQRLNRNHTFLQSSQAPLKGLLFDSNGNLMVPAHAKKNGLRYRYYQSWVLNHGQKERAGLVNRVPAQEIEAVVQAAVLKHQESLPEGDQVELRECVERIVVQSHHLKITLKTNDDALETIDVPWSKPPSRRRRELLATAENDASQKPMRSAARARLLRSIAQGRMWLEHMTENPKADLSAIAVEHRLSEKSVRSTISLAFLAPSIVEAAINGQLPHGLTVSQMIDLPSDWQEQRAALGLL